MEVIGRYALFEELARGGMATVHLGRLVGPGGFARNVAIKRLHPHLASDTAFVDMLLDEARLAGRIHHPNVVTMLDVVSTEGQLLLVMEFVHGEALVNLLRAAKARGERIPPSVAVAIAVNVLEGLHAAHEVRGEDGQLLGLVHRDVTPHNVMIRPDGTAVVVDFGVAKAAGRLHTTEEGKIKGKLPYMAPEQLRGGTVTRRVDVFAAGALTWEMLVGERAVPGRTEAEVLERLLFGSTTPPSARVPGLPESLDAVVMRAMAKDPRERFESAQQMARALEAALSPALPSRVASWLDALAHDTLARRQQRLTEIEATMVRAVLPVTPLPTEPSADRAAISRSDPASASVSAPVPPRPSSRGRLLWLAALAVAFALVGGVFARPYLTDRQEPALAPARDEHRPSEAASVTSTPAPLPSTTVDAAPVEEPAIPTPKATVSPSGGTRAAERPSPRPRPTPSSTVKPGCENPRTIDAEGRVIYKRECL